MIESTQEDILTNIKNMMDEIKAKDKALMRKYGYPQESILYKYSSWEGNEYIKENIKNSKLYFSRPTDFNDPFDTYPVIDLTSVKEEGKELILNLFKKIFPQISNETLEKIKEANIPIDESFMEKIRSTRSSADGVCCFTTKKDNLLMWAHYADYHKGICLGFDKNINLIADESKNKLITVPRAVIYRKRRPKIDYFRIDDNNDKDEISQVRQALYTKSKEWKYEDEYRCISMNYIGKVSYTPSNLKIIILGCKMTESNKNEVRELVKKMKYPPRIYEARMEKYKYGLEFVEDV